MSIMTEAEARAILTKVIALSTADQCTAQLKGSIDGNVRFALNNVSTSGIVSNIDLAVEVAFGKKVGIATINEFDDASLTRVVRRAEDLARLAPENPEFVPAVAKQTYKPSPTFSAATAAITPEYRAKVAADSIGPCRANKLVAAGFLQDGQSFVAFANSKGNFGYQRATSLDYTCTVRTDDGRGSGWVGRNLQDATAFNTSSDIQTAMRKASASADAKALEPGKYTVILEPAAAAGLLAFMFRDFDARSADEGRSFLSKKGGGNKVGEQVYDPRVNFTADPWHPDAVVMPWDDDGLPREVLPLVKDGKVANLQYSPLVGAEAGQEGQCRHRQPDHGGRDQVDRRADPRTAKGILVTRTWYIRSVDPQTVLLTGLTRDGTFYIENGAIKYPLKNFRFNESPVIMLNNIDELGRPVRVKGDESDLIMVLPPMKIRDFTFTSLSDAV